MFTHLVESRPRRERGIGGTVASALAHMTLGVLLVYGTANAVIKPGVEHVVPLPTVYSPPPPQPVGRHHDPQPPSTGGTRGCDCPVLPTIPVLDGRDIPVSIPEPGLALAVDPSDFRRHPTTSTGPAPGHDTGSPMDSFAVDRMATPLSANATPRYPEMLRTAGLEGRALLEFVVDSAGRVERESIRELQSTNAQFAQSARDALRDWRFHPAESGGRKVRVRMQQPFEFRLTR